MKRPAFQFYPADWRKDPALSACSLAARGLWIELMCIAHEGGTYGFLSINGKAMAPAQIARMVGESPAAVVKLIAELEDAGVFSRDEQGCIYSRRMVKDEHVRNIRADAGRLGGNPNLLKQKDKQTDNREPPPSSSSSSSVIEEAKASLSASAKPTDDETDDGVPPCPFDKLIDSYKKHLPELPDVRRSLFAGGKNGKAMRSRWRWVLTAKHERGPRIGERLAESAQDGVAWFDRYFAYVADSDFLTGKSGAFTGCDLGWLVNAANFEKVLSGKYHAEKREAANA
jgi:hypothetical protein